MSQQTAFAKLRDLQAIEPTKLVGFGKGRGIATGHPLDGVLENLGWFDKRFAPDMRADAVRIGCATADRYRSVAHTRGIGFASITSAEHMPCAIYSHFFTGA